MTQEESSQQSSQENSSQENSLARRSWLSRLKTGLASSSQKLSQSINSLFTKAKLDGQTLAELEETLIAADLGVKVAVDICDTLKKERFDKNIDPAAVRAVLARHVAAILRPLAKPLVLSARPRPHVILVVGVNGSGKTTTIAKLARHFKEQGVRVMLTAGDTFRAAAVEQLQIWGERLAIPVVAGKAGADAAGLAFQAIEQARKESIDLVLIDTAGRLQNKSDLMAELAKIRRVIQKIIPDAPHDTLLVLDATTGQNALSQIEIFSQTAGVTGLVMTKLDGTARGGVLVAAAEKFGLPIHAIGVGEQVDDLRAFEAEDFAYTLAGLERA